MTPWLLGPLPVQWPEQTHVLGSMQSTAWPRGGGAITPRADAGARRGRAPPSASAFSSCHSTYGGHLRERSCVPACFRECTACADSYLRPGMERKERGVPGTPREQWGPYVLSSPGLRAPSQLVEPHYLILVRGRCAGEPGAPRRASVLTALVDVTWAPRVPTASSPSGGRRRAAGRGK